MRAVATRLPAVATRSRPGPPNRPLQPTSGAVGPVVRQNCQRRSQLSGNALGRFSRASITIRPMAHIEFLEKLFKAHMADLKSVAPNLGDVFVCPICFRKFTLDAIYNEEVTDGHVWPDYIREKPRSALATSQRVLLCKTCNSDSGSRGDKQMQLLEKIKDAEKSGKFYGERRVEVIQAPNQKPIKLHAGLVRTGDLTARINFTRDRKRKQWARNNPQKQDMFLSLVEKGEKFSLIIRPHQELRASLAKTGWLTAGYLLAFYTFGYRYIFYEELQPVRDHILASFKNGPENLAFPKSDVISVTMCQTHNLTDPRIELDMPTSGNQPVHVEVSFLNYHVELPFHGVYEPLLDVIHLQMPDFEERLPELAQQDIPLRAPISCTKLDEHDCVWDYVMGKPIPTS